jgi:hypothetical protein
MKYAQMNSMKIKAVENVKDALLIVKIVWMLIHVMNVIMAISYSIISVILVVPNLTTKMKILNHANLVLALV